MLSRLRMEGSVKPQATTVRVSCAAGSGSPSYKGLLSFRLHSPPLYETLPPHLASTARKRLQCDVRAGRYAFTIDVTGVVHGRQHACTLSETPVAWRLKRQGT